MNQYADILGLLVVTSLMVVSLGIFMMRRGWLPSNHLRRPDLSQYVKRPIRDRYTDDDLPEL